MALRRPLSARANQPKLSLPRPIGATRGVNTRQARACPNVAGGLDVAANHGHLAPVIKALTDAGIRVSLFIDPDQVQIAVAHALGAPVVELHTGAYCEAVEGHRSEALVRLRQAAKQAAALGLEVHAGHGLTFDTVGPVAAIGEMAELNIGHFLVGEAIFAGLDSTIHRMRALMDAARRSGGDAGTIAV